MNGKNEKLETEDSKCNDYKKEKNAVTGKFLHSSTLLKVLFHFVLP